MRLLIFLIFTNYGITEHSLYFLIYNCRSFLFLMSMEEKIIYSFSWFPNYISVPILFPTDLSFERRCLLWRTVFGCQRANSIDHRCGSWNYSSIPNGQEGLWSSSFNKQNSLQETHCRRREKTEIRNAGRKKLQKVIISKDIYRKCWGIKLLLFYHCMLCCYCL